jgi:hypothetical protein
MMTNNQTHSLDHGDSPDFVSSGTASLKKPYETPVLAEWGTVRDLTRGPDAETDDMDFTGTGNV